MSFAETQDRLVAELEKRLSKKELAWFKRDVKLKCPDLYSISTEELHNRFDHRSGKRSGRVNDAALLRTFIWQVWVHMNDGDTEPIRGNVRALWYEHVEHLYRKHHLLDGPQLRVSGGDSGFKAAADRKPHATRADLIIDLMGEILVELVSHRCLTYRGMGFDEPFEYRAKVGRVHPEGFLYTEKEGLWTTVEPFSGDSGPDDPPPELTAGRKVFPSVSVMASSGEPSLLGLEFWFPRLHARAKSAIVGAMVDYDPWGYAIACAMDQKLRWWGFRKVETYLIITRELFTPDMIAGGLRLRSKMEKSKSVRVLVEHWKAKMGSIDDEDGYPIAVHADALGRNTLTHRAMEWQVKLIKKKLHGAYPMVAPHEAEKLCKALDWRLPLLG